MLHFIFLMGILFAQYSSYSSELREDVLNEKSTLQKTFVNLTDVKILPISGEVRKIIVFLHGCGGSGNGIYHYRKWLNTLPDTLFLSPNAPDTCEDAPDEYHAPGYQWWRWTNYKDHQHIREGLESAAPLLKKYLTKVMHEYKLQSNDIILTGVSQGCILALEMIYHVENLGGVLGYIGAFYPPSPLRAPQNSPSVFLINGTVDRVLPYEFFLESKNKLQTLGVNVGIHACEGLGHVDPNDEGLDVGSQYLGGLMSKI